MQNRGYAGIPTRPKDRLNNWLGYQRRRVVLNREPNAFGLSSSKALELMATCWPSPAVQRIVA